MSNAPILYIEDEEDYQILVKRILSKAGLEVQTADTAQEGLRLLREMRPSMLILDINLPDGDGYSICDELRKDPLMADLPVLMLTVRRRPEEWLRGFSSGANDYISKPLNPPELVERVVSCLEGKAQQYSAPGSAEYHLIQAAVAGNRAAFEVLIEKYRERLLEGMRQQSRNSEEAEDVVSLAFTRAYSSLGQFRGEASFYTWLYRIALNEASAFHRKGANLSLDEMTNNDESSLPKQLAEEDRTHEDLAERDSTQRVRDVLEKVPEPYREMLDLFFLKELSYEQIAQQLDIPVGTVMSRLFKARKLLQESWTTQNA